MPALKIYLLWKIRLLCICALAALKIYLFWKIRLVHSWTCRWIGRPSSGSSSSRSWPTASSWPSTTSFQTTTSPSCRSSWSDDSSSFNLLSLKIKKSHMRMLRTLCYRRRWRLCSWWCSPPRCWPRSWRWASCCTRGATWETPGTSWTSSLSHLGECNFLLNWIQPGNTITQDLEIISSLNG